MTACNYVQNRRCDHPLCFSVNGYFILFCSVSNVILVKVKNLSKSDKYNGSVPERSKALVLGTSLFGGVGSNPTAANTI